MPKEKGVSKKVARYHQANIHPEVWRVLKMLTPKPRELLTGDRRFLREGAIRMWSRKEKRIKNRVLFLFDDCLLVAKKEGSQKYWLKTFVVLRGRREKSVGIPAKSYYSVPNVEFWITTHSQPLVFFARTKPERDAWINGIRKAIGEVNVVNGIDFPDSGNYDAHASTDLLIDLSFGAPDPNAFQHQQQPALYPNEMPPIQHLSMGSDSSGRDSMSSVGSRESIEGNAQYAYNQQQLPPQQGVLIPQEPALIDPFFNENAASFGEFDFENAQRDGPNVFEHQEGQKGQEFAVLEEGHFQALATQQEENEKEVPSEMSELHDVLKSIVLSIKSSADQLKESAEAAGANAEEASRKDPREAAAEAALLGATGNLTHVIAELVRVATVAQESVWAAQQQSSDRSSTSSYRDNAWEEGLISAAKDVGVNIEHLVSATTKLSTNESTTDNVLASVREISGATARLVTAARVKIDPQSPDLVDLERATANAKQATRELNESVSAHTEAVATVESESQGNAGADLSNVSVHANKLEAMSDVARLERELEMARRKVQQIQKSEYQE